MFILTSPFPPLIHDALRQHLRSGSTGHIARWFLLLLRVCIQAGVPSQLRFAAVHTDAVSNPFNLALCMQPVALCIPLSEERVDFLNHAGYQTICMCKTNPLHILCVS